VRTHDTETKRERKRDALAHTYTQTNASKHTCLRKRNDGSFSRTLTLKPRLARARAAARPPMPPPMITIRVDACTASCRSSVVPAPFFPHSPPDPFPPCPPFSLRSRWLFGAALAGMPRINVCGREMCEKILLLPTLRADTGSILVCEADVWEAHQACDARPRRRILCQIVLFRSLCSVFLVTKIIPSSPSPRIVSVVFMP